MANPNLQMFRSDTPSVEIGTVSNPIDLGACNAGEDTELSYDILLWNDKGGLLGSNDAKEISIKLFRMVVSQNEVSDGAANQTFNLVYIPILSSVEQTILVNGVKWSRVPTLIGRSSIEQVYTLDYDTGILSFGDGVNGAIPTDGYAIAISYTPDLNTYGKKVYEEQWMSIKSNGVVANEVTIGSSIPEEATLLDSNTVQVLHYPEVTEIIGVWDNASKTGTNYYTGGSFNAALGKIYLGTAFTDETPYVEYKYEIKDESETSYSTLGLNDIVLFNNRIPSNNAKKIQLKVSVPSTAETESGVGIKIYLRVYYTF